MVSTHIHVNGVRLGVELRDSGKTSAPTLVLLHGFTGSASGWGSHLDTLATYGLRVIALDMLGHGQSDTPEDAQRYDMEHCQRDILAALTGLGIHKGEAILLGYSMGGRIALYVAFSGFFRALILESTSPGVADSSERVQRRRNDEALAASIERDGIEAFVEHWEQLPLFGSQARLPQEVREELHIQRLRNDAKGLAQSLRGMGTGVQPALHDQLPKLHLPVLLIAGELDSKFCALARQIAQALPLAQLCIVPDAGHTVHLEQPEVFDTVVKDFCLSPGVFQTSRQGAMTCL